MDLLELVGSEQDPIYRSMAASSMNMQYATITNSSSSLVLTENVAFDAIRDFFRDKSLVVFGTGMSCALDVRFGMEALKEELCRCILPDSLTAVQNQQWTAVVQTLHSGSDLETALGHVSDVALIQTITSVTAEFISSIDREYALQISNGTAVWPAAEFFKRLVETLPEGDPTLHVVTPNYDTLFEHACEAARISYTNGFIGVMERYMDWEAIDRSLHLPQAVTHSGRTQTRFRLRKHARLYKVHGSLSFFFHKDSLVENTAWMWNPPQFATRVLITPGFTKYESLQHYRRELLRSADEAVAKSKQFLFLGYGFNDSHLERYIKEKLTSQSCKGLIITRDSNPRIECLLKDSENLWLVCKAQDDWSEGTQISNRRYSNPLVIPNRKLWDISTFASEILGVNQ